ncbi:hypothetical protein HanPSC8_Chr15g0651261 [Helianthus annuus]|nr:hypothetical protein HanPSC8_Chr15g0651261 [Helianthus annuus]
MPIRLKRRYLRSEIVGKIRRSSEIAGEIRRSSEIHKSKSNNKQKNADKVKKTYLRSEIIGEIRRSSEIANEIRRRETPPSVKSSVKSVDLVKSPMKSDVVRHRRLVRERRRRMGRM